MRTILEDLLEIFYMWDLIALWLAFFVLLFLVIFLPLRWWKNKAIPAIWGLVIGAIWGVFSFVLFFFVLVFAPSPSLLSDPPILDSLAFKLITLPLSCVIWIIESAPSLPKDLGVLLQWMPFLPLLPILIGALLGGAIGWLISRFKKGLD